jgi:MYXO-CTERM domain-containing protein
MRCLVAAKWRANSGEDLVLVLREASISTSRLLQRALLLWAIVLAPLARADLVVPANAVVDLGGGTIDLACTDLVVAGTLQVGSGQVVNVRNVTIQAGGVLHGGSGVIALGGSWSNSGQFIAGTGTVRFEDLCGLAGASIGGNSTFFDLRFVSSIGRSFAFAVGSTQTITSALRITGVSGSPIQIRSSAVGQVANINLQAGGTQQIQHVGVTDVWATGQPLAPNQTNEGGGGNAQGWFGSGQVTPTAVPTLGDFTVALLAALLGVAAAWRLRAQRRRSGHRFL